MLQPINDEELLAEIESSVDALGAGGITIDSLTTTSNSSKNPQEDDHDDAQQQDDNILQPLLGGPLNGLPAASASVSTSNNKQSLFRSRKTPDKRRKKRHRHGTSHGSSNMDSNDAKSQPWYYLSPCCGACCRSKSTLHCMNCMAKMLLWVTFVSLAAAVVWYSYELFNHGTDPHLIAWFSAGAFVLLGFPISMFGIVGHLANYNQPHVQVYVVRILFMVPVYSIESWLAMRFHNKAIYIETLRDFYESYVLYSFLQFLIQVLGGEEALVLMLKDKSPTRGAHMWGLQWCVKPWLMGQPVRRTVYEHDDESGRKRALKQIHWKSPFFIKCKFGVLQYVLLKILCSIVVLLLEWQGLYKEGDFSWKGSYLYICLFTNISQCWALYCLIIFYYATHNELSPINPVGKFLSVKALVFFTWWQSVAISMLYQAGMMPSYTVGDQYNLTPEDVAKGIQDYLICIEMFVAAVVHIYVFPHSDYSPQAVEARTRSLNQMPMKWHSRRVGRGGRFWKDDASKCSTERYEFEMATIDSADGSLEAWEHLGSAPAAGGAAAALKASSRHSRNSSLGTDDSPLGGPFDEAEEGNPRPDPITEEDEDADGNDDDEVDGESGDEDETEAVDNTLDALSDDGTRIKTGFVRALWDSAIPLDLRDNTFAIVKGDFHVERKSLLQHAVTSDQYDLFAQRKPVRKKKLEP